MSSRNESTVPPRTSRGGSMARSDGRTHFRPSSDRRSLHDTRCTLVAPIEAIRAKGRHHGKPPLRPNSTERITSRAWPSGARTVHLSNGVIERVEWVEDDKRVVEKWDKGTKTSIITTFTKRDGASAAWTYVWDSAERVWRASIASIKSTTLILRGTVLSKADVSVAFIITAATKDIVRVEMSDGSIEFPEGDDGTFFTKDAGNKKTFRREFAASHSQQHGEVHYFEKGVK
eukprot:4236456-Prymnesium_polylepis.1